MKFTTLKYAATGRIARIMLYRPARRELARFASGKGRHGDFRDL